MECFEQKYKKETRLDKTIYKLSLDIEFLKDDIKDLNQRVDDLNKRVLGGIDTRRRIRI